MDLLKSISMNTGVVLIILLLAVYLMTTSVVKLIDQKIGDIEIKLPHININTKLNVSKDVDGLIHITPENGDDISAIKNNVEKFLTTAHTAHATPVSYNIPTYTHNSSDNTTVVVDNDFNMIKLPNAKPILSNTTNESVCPLTKVGCTEDADCNVVNGGNGDGSSGNGKNICKKDGTCYCLSGSGKFCQYGPTNYKDPNSMTTEERDVFKYQFRNNFTLQDYKNWLMLYKSDPQHLRENHRDNLSKLLRGQPLYFQDMPNIRIKPPMDPADYFSKMYEGGKISVHFPEESETGAMLGYNYGKYSEFISPEQSSKTWITGIEDLYKNPNKDNARELNYYLRPEVTVGVERQMVGQEYLNWVKRHHNLADIRKLQIRQDESINTFQSTDPSVIAPY